ncbi:Hsp20/alpha crystallin family protein [Candidatus Nomurabacteria bacterium]|nr:Hsp20/alpha crystallin family protein [Candidatus Nomurabacteria bacterium]
METKKDKRSFFERLTGSRIDEDYEEPKTPAKNEKKNGNNWIEEENEEAELSLDLYQTPTDIVIQTMVAGVKPEDLELSIARDMVTIRGKREESRIIDEDNFFAKELYWGRFSRTISLPVEVEPEEVEATEKHGLVTIKIKKVDKEKKNSVKIRSI